MNSGDYRIFQKSVEFLKNHPAVNMSCDTFFSLNFVWWYAPLCRHGEIKEVYCEGDNPSIMLRREDDKVSEEEFMLLAARHAEPDETDERFKDPGYTVVCRYKDIYGHVWEYDRDAFYGDCSIYKYDVNFKSNGMIDKLCPPARAFREYMGEHVREAASYEDLIIDMAGKVSMHYGDFTYDSFLTPAERENHRVQHPFFLEDNGDGTRSIVDNPSHVNVYDCQISLRWWDWYRETEHYKAHWAGE
jgi:hypothetical protein